MRASLAELTDAIVAIGVERRDAEYAVTQRMIMDTKLIQECVAEQQTEEARSTRRKPSRELRP